MSLEQMSREQLLGKLESLLAKEQEKERALHDLRAHQLALEVQNGALRGAQGALEESRKRYADLYDFAPIAYYTFDPQGCIQGVNLTGATMVGLDRAQLTGTPFLALVQMEEPALFWKHLERCADSRSPVVSEFAFSTGHAGLVQVQAVSAPVFGPAGQAVAFRTAFTDIGDRKRAEAERKQAFESEHFLRKRLEVLDRAGMVVATALATLSASSFNAVLQVVVEQARIIVDAEYAAFGVGDGPERPFKPWVFSGLDPKVVERIGRLPRAVGLLGVLVGDGTLRVRDLREHPSFGGFPPHHPAMTSFLGVPVRYGENFLASLYLANKRGAEEFSEADQRSIEMLAERVGIAMEIARLNDAAQEAIRSRDNVLAIVYHDLRNPLAAVSLSADLLAQACAQDQRGRLVRKPIEIIKRSAERMNRLIGDLLTATMIESKRFTANRRPNKVAELLGEAVQVLEPLMAEKSLRFEQRLLPDLPAVVCDRERILQVLSNLIGNSVKFTAAGGRIRIEIGLREREVCFAVSDTGPGISSDKLPQVFDRYWKGESSERAGIGLGLYIAKGIVEAHDGRIWAESKVGEGSTFFFTLPVVSPPDGLSGA